MATDKLLIEFMTKQSATSARIEEKVDNLHSRVIEIAKTVKDGENGAVLVKTELDKRIAKLELHRKLDRRWLAGAFAVIVAEGSILGWYFNTAASKIQTMVKTFHQ